ncbi:unnamed protein product [Durusdinium trenchii]|uniref:Uncharacterized protein n=1 Tax=Durusdinium trenchii TaxID=1381693 RepID=A0ABP0J624_9DINO
MAPLAELHDLLHEAQREGEEALQEALRAAQAALLALRPKEVFRLDSQRLRFIWLLLPEFWERPTAVAAAAAANRAMNGLLCAGQGLLHVSHLSLHPNSLTLEGQRALEQRALRGCLMKIALDRLLSVQFHMPRLPDVLALLEALARSPCRCLRKIVDRQSRWRPRELQFEQMEEEQRRSAAEVAELLNELPHLQHLEGPVFSVLLRARRHASEATPTSGGQTPLCSGVEQGRLNGICVQSAFGSPCSSCSRGCAGALGERLRVLHLVDLCAGDLFGLLPSGAEGSSSTTPSSATPTPFCPSLQKLLLLNLPSAAPGLTAQVICKFLPQAPELKELQLDFQYFDPALWDLESLEALVARVQAAPSKITKLVLDWCRLGDAGVRCVCAALARHARQRGEEAELSLAHCELKDLSHVCEMLETPGLALTSLDLSANSFGDEEGLKLAKSLPLSTIKELRLRDSQVSARMPVKTKWSWSS